MITKKKKKTITSQYREFLARIKGSNSFSNRLYFSLILYNAFLHSDKTGYDWLSTSVELKIDANKLNKDKFMLMLAIASDLMVGLDLTEYFKDSYKKGILEQNIFQVQNELALDYFYKGGLNEQ